MRHGNLRQKLSMRPSHRRATLGNMVKSLIIYQKMETTRVRAKAARTLAEHLITLAKNDTVTSRRRAYTILNDRDLVSKLFKEIAPLFKTRTSGYTRIIPLGFRRGDGADMVIFELTEKTAKKKEKKVAEKAAKQIKEESHEENKAGAPKKAAAGEPKKHEAPHKKEVKEESKIKTLSKSRPTLQEEKMAEKAKTEERKMAGNKNFMKNLRGLFHKRGD